MGREDCMMCDIVGGKVYCAYYDFMYNLCTDVKDCPEGLDDEDCGEEYDEDDIGEWDEWEIKECNVTK